MAKAILTTKISPAYDDRPEQRYHFPATYLNQVRAAIGDHIIYYEPRRSSADLASRGGRRAYFATARVDDVVADDVRPNHFYALISMYLDFDSPVPFAEGTEYYESALQKEDGSTNKGAFGRAVRTVPDAEFEKILKTGFASELRSRAQIEPALAGFAEFQTPFERPIVEMTISRPFRESAFKRVVRSAYDKRCALTGLRLINGGGRPEVQAAHIMPVAASGPDSVRNGLALSSTFHWAFDRGLISATDDGKILVAEKLLPEQITSLLNRDRALILPYDPSSRPHAHFLRFHREQVFKG